MRGLFEIFFRIFFIVAFSEKKSCVENVFGCGSETLIQ